MGPINKIVFGCIRAITDVIAKYIATEEVNLNISSERFSDKNMSIAVQVTPQKEQWRVKKIGIDIDSLELHLCSKVLGKINEPDIFDRLRINLDHCLQAQKSCLGCPFE